MRWWFNTDTKTDANFLTPSLKMKNNSARALSLFRRFRVMRGKEIAFGPGKMELSEWVAETGSIGKAAKRMKMSYMRAWSLIQTMNTCFKEPVIKAVRGGNERGGAEVTGAGRRVLKLYRQMEKDSLRAVRPNWRKLQTHLHDG